MKRAAMPQSTKQMKRSPFKPKAASMPGILRTANIKPGSPRLRASRNSIRSKGPRMTPIRKSARGEECTLRLPGVCNFDPTTTVLCHENGAGGGMKSPDECGAYGCYACHMVLDGHVTRPAWLTRDFVLDAFARANALTRQILKRKGLIT